MKKHLYFLFIIFIVSCNSKRKRALVGVSEFQKEMNIQFKDASKSPLTKNGLKKFKGLDFFPIDKKYKVVAKLVATPDSPFFNFPTTTDRVVEYKKYGEVYFTIDHKDLKLAIYKSKVFTEENKHELFLPFLDKTNGKTSYAGGRYIDVLMNDADKEGTITIDFNEAYNPYCAYNERYSCPITPRSNFLDIEIEAGVMAYKK